MNRWVIQVLLVLWVGGVLPSTWAQAETTELDPTRVQRPLRLEGRYFKDRENRAVQLRGFSVAGTSKVPPFERLRPEELNPLVDLGANVIRLLVSWEALEPERGVYNSSYLAYLDSLVEHAGALGLYVIIDLHQDAYSRYSIHGCGDGFPRWSVPEDRVKVYLPDNGKWCSLWSLALVFDSDLYKTWNLFYQDYRGVRTRFIELWSYLAEHFRNFRNVIGYDILNEPGGDEKKQIGPLYEDAARAIRNQDPDSILFLTPQVFNSTGKPTQLDRPSFDQFVYSAHYYSPTVAITHAWFHMSPKRTFTRLQALASQWGVPLFLGEFGGLNGVWGIKGYIDSIYDQLDEMQLGGAQWVYTPGWNSTQKDGWNQEDLSVTDDQGRLRRNFHVRPYPRVIAGDYLNSEFRVHLKPSPVLSFRWRVGWDEVGKVTEIFAPQEFFDSNPSSRSPGPLGSDLLNSVVTEPAVLTSSHVRCHYNETGTLLLCQAERAGLHELIVRGASSPLDKVTHARY